MTEPKPPPRPAMLDGHMGYGQPREEAPRAMFESVVSLLRYRDRWQGLGYTVLLGTFEESSAWNASVDFTWQSAERQGAGRMTLSIDPEGWTRVDVFVGGGFLVRGWFEQVWEEIEFWPDGSDGVEVEVPGFIGTEAAGRIGKHRHWLQIDATKWPLVPPEPRWIQFERRLNGEP